MTPREMLEALEEVAYDTPDKVRALSARADDILAIAAWVRGLEEVLYSTRRFLDAEIAEREEAESRAERLQRQAKRSYHEGLRKARNLCVEWFQTEGRIREPLIRRIEREMARCADEEPKNCIAAEIRAAIREELKDLRSVFDQREPVDLDDEFANGWDDAAEFAQTQIDIRIRELEEK